MLFKVCIKRFRWALYCGVIFVALVYLTNIIGGDAGGAIGAICFFLFAPATLILFIWAVVKAVQDVAAVRIRGEAPPVDEPGVVSVWFSRLGDKLKNERAAFAALDAHGRRRCIIMRVIGALLAVGGFAMYFFDIVIIATLVLIAGLALWMMALPTSYNEAVDGAKMLTCPAGLDMDALCRGLETLDTPLGTPYLANVKFVKGKSLVFGPDSDGTFIYLYKTADGRRMYMAVNPIGEFVQEALTKRLRAPYELRADEATQAANGGVVYEETDPDALLDELFSVVSNYISTGVIAPTQHVKPL